MVSGQASASSLPHGKTSALNRAATNPRRPRTTQLNRRVGGWSTGRLRRREAICCAGSRSPEDPWRNFSSAWQPTLTVQTWATAIASQSRSTRLASCILLWCQPQRPRLKSLKPVSIQVRIPYQLTSASSGSRSVSTAQADSYPASQCMSNVHFRRLPFPAKHSTVPFQLVPGVGVHRLIQSNVSSPTARALTPRLIRKNGCHPQSMITWNNQRAYSPRSAITSTCQSAGMLPSRCVSKPSQCGRHKPFSCPPKTFHAPGIAHLHTTTLMDKIVQSSPNVVASKTSTSCRFPFPHRRTIHCNKGAKHEVTSSSRRFFPLLCFASRYHSRKRWNTVCSCCSSTRASRALICVIPATPESAIPALQSTRPHICGLLKWPKAVDTSWDHCDNRSGQDIFVLLLLMNFSCFIAYWARGWSAHLSTRTRRPTLLTWLVLTRESARCAFNHSQERCSVTAPKSHGRSEYQIA